LPPAMPWKNATSAMKAILYAPEQAPKIEHKVMKTHQRQCHTTGTIILLCRNAIAIFGSYSPRSKAGRYLYSTLHLNTSPTLTT
jgi:hypothetical protein